MADSDFEIEDPGFQDSNRWAAVDFEEQRFEGGEEVFRGGPDRAPAQYYRRWQLMAFPPQHQHNGGQQAQLANADEHAHAMPEVPEGLQPAAELAGGGEELLGAAMQRRPDALHLELARVQQQLADLRVASAEEQGRLQREVDGRQRKVDELTEALERQEMAALAQAQAELAAAHAAPPPLPAPAPTPAPLQPAGGQQGQGGHQRRTPTEMVAEICNQLAPAEQNVCINHDDTAGQVEGLLVRGEYRLNLSKRSLDVLASIAKHKLSPMDEQGQQLKRSDWQRTEMRSLKIRPHGAPDTAWLHLRGVAVPKQVGEQGQRGLRVFLPRDLQMLEADAGAVASWNHLLALLGSTARAGRSRGVHTGAQEKLHEALDAILAAEQAELTEVEVVTA